MNEKYKVLCVTAALALCACATKPTLTTDTWTDATLVAEQAAVIEQQRRTLDDLGAVVNTIRDDLAGARADLDRAISEARDLREQWTAIDQFVRRVIDAERELEELQSTNRGTDAGTR